MVTVYLHYVKLMYVKHIVFIIHLYDANVQLLLLMICLLTVSSVVEVLHYALLLYINI